jgi:alanine racemase
MEFSSSSFDMRPTYIEIDCSKLNANLDVIQKHLYKKDQKKIPIMAIVKANAYGHGLIETARVLEKTEIDYLGVAFLEEGIELRCNGITIPILVLGGILGEQIPHFIENDLTLTASSVEKFQHIETYCKQHKTEAKVHLKIDSGMERIGIHYYSATPLLELASKSKYVSTEGIFSHFANADLLDLTDAKAQLKRFQEVLNVAKNIGLSFRYVHMANSGAILQLPDSWFSMVRVGILMYGVYPNPQIPQIIPVQPILSWYTKIVYFKVIQPNHPVSYGSTWQSDIQTRLITLPVGYGDGYHRRMSGHAQVILREKKYAVVGTICMDQMMVNINWDSGYNAETVVLIGSQGGEKITIEDLADWSGTITYEILTSINKRVPRIYI